MRSWRWIVLLAALSLVSADSASAQRRPGWSQPYAKSGLYAGISAGWPLWVSTNGAEGRDNDSAVGVSGSIYGGYRFHPSFAIDAMLEVGQAGDVGVDFNRGDDYTITHVTFTLNTRFYFGHGRFQPYGVLGIGGAKTVIDPDDASVDDDDRSHFVARGGLGIDMYATRWLAFQLEFSGAVGTRGYGQFAPRMGLLARF